MLNIHEIISQISSLQCTVVQDLSTLSSRRIWNRTIHITKLIQRREQNTE